MQRWSKRFRDAVDSPLSSRLNLEIQENQSNQQLNTNLITEDNDGNQIQKQINANAKKSESTHSTV